MIVGQAPSGSLHNYEGDGLQFIQGGKERADIRGIQTRRRAGPDRRGRQGRPRHRKAVSFSGWSETRRGDKRSRVEVRKGPKKYELHEVPRLFDKAYEYIAANYYSHRPDGSAPGTDSDSG